MIDIRAVDADDWRLWRRARLAALAGAPDAFRTRLADWQGEGDREERWRARLSIPGAHDLLALRHGEPVGIASGVPEPDRGAARVISIWVDRSARGLGVGDLLLGSVERWAAENRYTTLRLGVFADNEHAIALYRRNGFEFESERQPTAQPAVLDADNRVERIMVKGIVPAGR
ncbi:GNAT family N-acetyltransferase [Nocardia africana]|uniref:Predicted acetyltransferase n=1 Tax=Nocardia africana TaxID=134964 RepID=A0A378X5W3_9NOCA|nr:GNAT family N-acetyltransferase [Nocardia africana]MCC3317328.1 GNAT family N-acetyltransferase [Nocardia africana]SUA48061.1 Predicted acetyltransferase [Nocardia africana]